MNNEKTLNDANASKGLNAENGRNETNGNYAEKGDAEADRERGVGPELSSELRRGERGRTDCEFPVVEPWPEAADGKALLDELEATLTRFVVLPKWASETLALFALHTYAYELRDVTTYVGVESPEKRCGKTTLLTVLGELVNRPVMASNISSPAFFRVIQQTRPTLLIDEADMFLQGNDELRGILNSGYTRKTAFVWRVANQVQSPESKVQSPKALAEGGGNCGSNAAVPLTPASVNRLRQEHPPSSNALRRTNYGGRESTTEGKPTLSPSDGKRGKRTDLAPKREREREESYVVKAVKFSSWCPKVMAAIGRLPETLADRCIVIRMQRKMWDEECDWVRNLDARTIVRKCARFARDNASAIGPARPEIPEGLNDRAGDIWEPLLALADLAGGDWPGKARQAAVELNAGAQESSPIGTLLLDIFTVLVLSRQERMFSRALVNGLNRRSAERAWVEALKGKDATEQWLSNQLRPYGIKPKTMRIGEERAKGYVFEEFTDVFRRYVPMAEVEAMRAEMMEGAKKL